MLLLPGLGAVALALSACDEIMEPGPGDGATPPPQQPANGGFTPDRERVVGFPALFPSQRLGHSAEETLRAREAEQEAARVRAMHQRDGTGGRVSSWAWSRAAPIPSIRI